MTVFRKVWDLRFLHGAASGDRSGTELDGHGQRGKEELPGDGISPWSLTLGLGSPQGPCPAHEGPATVEMEGM